ncbi:MAG: hypothetical protein PF961_20505 [Planctomycetota bacterium]|nr:hypothetical protein [Planctomycetota bacterium]
MTAITMNCVSLSLFAIFMCCGCAASEAGRDSTEIDLARSHKAIVEVNAIIVGVGEMSPSGGDVDMVVRVLIDHNSALLRDYVEILEGEAFSDFSLSELRAVSLGLATMRSWLDGLKKSQVLSLRDTYFESRVAWMEVIQGSIDNRISELTSD